jgi:cytidylate kinase
MINIAIDGYAGCGKSTTARRVAEALGYVYVDTGAMYRAVTLFILENDLDFSEENEPLNEALESIELDFSDADADGHRFILLNGENVESRIRTPEVSRAVSPVATLKSVRKMLVAQQQRMPNRKGFVIDGRDIGTVVLPHAELKVFMTADMDVRVARRRQELEAKNIFWKTDDIRKNMLERDHIDSNREEGPLSQAEDAKVLDTSDLTIDDQVRMVVGWANSMLKEKPIG